MKNIEVTLLHHTPLYIASLGARTCWDSFDKSDTDELVKQLIEDFMKEETEGNVFDSDEELIEYHVRANTIGSKDLDLLDRVVNQYHHASIAEHISFNFFIDGISRACLQEVSRHRHTSLSVKSSRYTLKELKSEDSFTTNALEGRVRAEKYLFMTIDETVNRSSVLALENLRSHIQTGTSNDIAKYCMPEAFRTQLTWSINLRSLQNFLSLRTDKKALPEIQHLAKLIYEALPEDAKSLVKHCVRLEQK